MVKNKTSKGQGATARRAEKRKKRFAPEAPGKGARANVLRDEDPEGEDTRAAPNKKRRREDGGDAGGIAVPARKTFKQGPFARPAAAARERTEPAALPLSRKELKQVAEGRKATRKPNHTLIQELTLTWEKLRRKNVAAEERSKLVTELSTKMSGRARVLAGSHKASRVLQSVLKYGTPQQIAALSAELRPDLPALAKDAYGTHLVRRLIDVAPKEDLQALVNTFKPTASRLARHPFAAPALDALYVRCTAAQRASLLATFYGPQMALARNAVSSTGSVGAAAVSLASVLQAQATPAGRRSVLSHVAAALTPILEKGLVSFAYVHRLLAEYLPLVGPAGLADASASVAGPALLRMIHTPDGTRAASMLLAGASARERKACIKALKGRVVDVAQDPCGHVALVAALECVDDTTLLAKGLLAEVQARMLDVALHPSARRLILNLLHPRCGRYLPPDIMAALPVAQEARVQAENGEAAPGNDVNARDGGEDDDDDDDDHGVGDGKPGVLAASKKPPAVRRAQLLAFIGQGLVQMCSANAAQLLAHQHGCDVIYEVARGGEGDALRTAVGDAQMQQLIDALATAVAAPESTPICKNTARSDGAAADDDAATSPLREEFHASRTLRRLVLDSPQAADALWTRCLSADVARWATGHGAKVLAACCVCAHAKTSAAAGAALKQVKGVLCPGQTASQWAAQFMNTEHAAEGDKNEAVQAKN